MVWFVIASIVGFGAYWLFVRYRDLLCSGLAVVERRALVWASVLTAIIIAFSSWASFSNRGRFTAERLGEMIGSATSARFLLGFLLGAVAAYAVDHGVFSSNATVPASPPVRRGLRPRPPSPPNQGKNPAGTADKFLMLSIAAAVALLALVAPYLDDWFSRVAGFKTSWIEIQLTNISASTQAVKPDNRKSFVDEVLLDFFQKYDETLKRDIAYIGFELRDLDYREKKVVREITDREVDESSSELRSLLDDKEKLKQQRQQLTNLYELFHDVVSPVAGCIRDAISNGLNVESIRQKLGDAADMVTQLIIFEANEKKVQEDEEKQTGEKRAEIAKQRDEASQRLQKHRRNIREMAASMPKRVQDFLDPTQRVKCDGIKIKEATSIPYYGEYEALPHLYVARAALLWFVNHDLLAIKVLEEALRKPFKEFDAPRLLALLMYYQDDPADRFAHILEQMRATARERQQLMERVEDRCAPQCDRDDDELKNRARRAELYAVNTLAYAIAEDLAKELDRAEPLRPIAEDYGQILSEAVKSEAAKNKFIEKDRDYLLDTAAFVTIVAEAKRAKSNSLDKEKVRTTIRVLEKIVSREEERLDSPKNQRRKFQYDSLDTYRAHLNAARTLLK
jgi:hypothetical protein